MAFTNTKTLDLMNKKKIIFLGITLILVLSPYIASADETEGLVPCGNTPEDPCTLCDFFVLIKRIIDFLIAPPGGIVFIVATLILVAGGVMFLTSAGEPDKIAKATKTMTNAVLGLIIIFAAWLFISMLYSIMGYGWGKWYEIKCSSAPEPVARAIQV